MNEDDEGTSYGLLGSFGFHFRNCTIIVLFSVLYFAHVLRTADDQKRRRFCRRECKN